MKSYKKSPAYTIEVLTLILKIMHLKNSQQLVTKTSVIQYTLYYKEEALEKSTLFHEIIEEIIALLADEAISSDTFIGQIYEALLSTEDKKALGQVYTPAAIIEEMIGEAIKDKGLNLNSKILDPSCGSGYFLIALTQYLKKHLDYSLKEIIEEMIYGVDINPVAVYLTKASLALLTEEILDLSHIVCQNFLVEDNALRFDFIIGNPPYIGHKKLDRSYRLFLMDKYAEVFYEKADIFYCFFMKSVQVLKAGGRVSFIISRYFLNAKYGDKLRAYLAMNTKLEQIIDFEEARVFKKANIQPIILQLALEEPQGKLCYKKHLGESRDQDIWIEQKDLNKEPWCFFKPEEVSIMEKLERYSRGNLGSHYAFHQGIITGCDKAFIVEDKQPYIQENMKVKSWVKNSDIKAFAIASKGKYLLYTDKIEDISKYPLTDQQIRPYQAKLEKRRECQNGIRKWYELQWGRDESLFDMKKIMFPFKAESNRFALDTAKRACSADVYMITDIGMISPYSLEYLTAYLNTDIAEFFIKKTAKRVGKGLYEYYPYTVKNMPLPMDDFPEKLEEMLQNKYKYNMAEINQHFYDIFKLNESEIKMIQEHNA